MVTAMDAEGPLVGIALCTKARPDGLRAVLDSLAAQDLADVACRVVVAVVDNDPGGSAESTVVSMRPAFPWPLRYAVEPDPGIPAARRRSVELTADADAVVFVDDDEVAPPEWLATLVRHWRGSGADVVTGPSRRVLPADAPAWAQTSDLFDPTNRRRTGTRLSKAYTNNVLVARHVLDAVTPAFDDTFRHTGSSDLHFFLRVAKAGFTIEWCEEAVIDEVVPDARLTWGWYLRRAYRSGAGDAIARRLITPGAQQVLTIAGRGVARVAYGVVVAPLALVLPRYRSLSLRRIASGVGTLAGLFGHNYEEYRAR